MKTLRPFIAALSALLALLLGLPAAAATYSFRTDTYAWESASTAISWNGSCTDYPGDDDKATISFSGGFTFSFAGTAYSSVRVLSNGMLQFGADTGLFRNYVNEPLPAGTADSGASGCATAATSATLMAYWTDLDPTHAGSGNVTWQQKGTAPNRYVVVSWNGVHQYEDSTPFTFQVILYENGEFKYQYGDANTSGLNATIGVQVGSSDFTQYSYDSSYNANGTAIRWYPTSLNPARAAEYRMDETSWSGAAGEVADSSGNGRAGTRVGSANTSASGFVCRAMNVPANTNATASAVDTLIDVTSSIGTSGSISMWFKSNVAWSSTTPALLFDATNAVTRPFYLMRRNGGALRLAIADVTGTALVATTAAQSFAANTWVHVAASWRLVSGTNQSSLRIYINGVQAAVTYGTTTGNLHPSMGTLYLGDNRSSATPTGGTLNSANGLLDEVRLYAFEVSPSELALDMAATHGCGGSLDHIEVTPASASGSTCSPSTVNLKACADAACSSVLDTYTGSVLLSTSSLRGDWAAGTGPAPQGTLANGTANDGAATYTFSALDNGIARLTLSHSLAQDLTVKAADSLLPGSAGTSTTIAFRDNSFVLSEDGSGRIAGADVAVAGRPHDYTVSLIKKDPATGSCGVATDFDGSRTLKMWRTDSNGSWTAPSVVSPALSIPAAQPAAGNLTLSFTNGVASFDLGSTDIGRYALNLLDDSLSYASLSISGSSNTLTVRPFALVVQAIKQTTTDNPGGSLPGDAVFTTAGARFQATLGAYRWSAAMTGNGTDGNNDGTPDAGATLANTTAGGLAPSFNSTVALVPLAASQTPATGVMGSLNNGSVSGFVGGTVTPTNLSYTEVGSFALDPLGVTTNYLGSGIALDATVFNVSGVQNTRVGRFIPARFALSGGTLTHRVNAGCSPASGFTYLGENFQLQFTLTAQNALGATTLNYHGSYAKLDPGVASAWQLAGISGSTAFLSAGAGARLSLGTSTGSWNNGVAAGITLGAAALRASSADGPFSASFGIAPVDSDGVSLGSHDIDTALPAGNDHTRVATVALRFGRLRLMNGIGSQDRPLALPLVAQYWDGSAFADNTLDSCTQIPATAVNFGNYRKTLTPADTSMAATPVTLAAGRASLVLAKPAGGRSGTVDVALSLGSTATDASCLQPWTPGSGDGATVGAGLAFLRGAWCSTSYDKDPSARASFGLYRGADNLIHQRENY